MSTTTTTTQAPATTPFHVQLAQMGTSVEQFRARVARLVNPSITANRLTATQYREQVGDRYIIAIRKLAAEELRALADYRRIGLTAAAARERLWDISQSLATRTRHWPQTTMDRLANADYRRRERQRTIADRRAAEICWMIPEAWCGFKEVRWVDNQAAVGVTYHQEVEWPEERRRRGPTWPSRKYDVLTVSLLRRTRPAISADDREITVGPWTYRRGRGHQLSVQYHSQGLEADRAAFAAEPNAERQAAIINACGEDLTDLFDVAEIQRDDFGRLYRLSGSTRDSLGNKAPQAIGVFVRVVCPSTGRVYWLQVQSSCRTAREAVAATFGMTAQEYAPAQQT